MTFRLQPGRFLVLALCLLLALFSCAEAAHGHPGFGGDAGGHCPLCLLAHTAAILPVLLTFVPLLLLFARRTRIALCRGSRPCVRTAFIRPPPVLA